MVARNMRSSGPPTALRETARISPLPPTPQPLPQTPREQSAFAPVGFGFLIVFLFLMFSRICDFYFSHLHLPLFFSSCALIAALFSGNFFTPLRSRIGISLMLFSIWLVLATPMSVWKGGSYAVVVDDWSKALAVFFVVNALAGSISQVVKVIRTVAYSMLAVTVLAFLLGVKTAGRLTLPQGSYSGPNELATAMILGCIYAWFIISNPAHSKIRRFTGFVMLVPLALIMMKTGSRGAVIALGVVCLFLMTRYSLGQKIIMITVLMLAAVVAVLVLPKDIFNRYSIFFSRNI